ncbi:MAG: YegS/Rv2252/BmrU family lipid kinase [Actinomycetes bacterium]
MHWAIIVNPHSGKRRALVLGHEVRELATAKNIEVTWISGASAIESANSLRASIASNTIDAVVVVGGDGLVNLAVQELAGTSIPMGVLAAGTGNDFARSSKTFGLTPAALVDLMTSQNPVAIDAGRVSVAGKERWFVQVLSTGFDSMVNERANRFSGLKGKMKYNIATALELPRFRPKSYSITADGREITTKAMLVAIANGATYGGGMQICPNADRHDGLFDVLVLHPVPILEFIRVFPKVFKGTHVTHPKVEIFRARSISITADAVAYADGERYGDLPVKADSIPQALYTWVC